MAAGPGGMATPTKLDQQPAVFEQLVAEAGEDNAGAEVYEETTESCW